MYGFQVVGFSPAGGANIDVSALIYSNHIARVEADGGVIPDKPLLLTTIQQLVALYAPANEAAFKAALPVSAGKIFGYKAGSGSGVTAGQACEKLYSINQAADIVQATAANQPLLLLHSGTNYYWASRVTGNSITGTHSMTFTGATDTLVITAKVFFNNQNSGGVVDYVVSMGAAGILGIANNGTSKILRFRGSANATDSTAYTPSATAPHWVRITSAPAGVIYEWSANGTSWTGIGTPARPTVGSIASCTIGSTAANTANVCSVYYATVQNVTTAQTITFDPAHYNRNYAQTGWIGGNATWAITTATTTTGYKGVMVDETVIMGNGVDTKLSVASLALNQPNTTYLTMRRLGTGPIVGRGATASIGHDATNLTLNNGTALNISNSGRLRQFVATVSNGASSSIQIDNGTATTGNAGTNNGTYLDLCANATAYGNHIIESVVVSNVADSAATRTEMYNIFGLDSANVISITGDSIASRLYSEGLENLVRGYNAFYQNNAYAGSNLAKITINDPASWNPWCFVERSKVGATNIIDITNVDVLLVWAGFNDKNDSVPLGAIDSDNEETIAGAIRVGVANYRARKPGMTILFMNPSANPYETDNPLGLSLQEYAEHISAVCASINVPCLNMFTESGINESNYTTAIMADRVHPTAAYIANPIAGVVANYLSDRL